MQGRTAFNPTLLKLACGEHEEFTEVTKSEWLDYGTGMMAMYKTDWLDVGGRSKYILLYILFSKLSSFLKKIF